MLWSTRLPAYGLESLPIPISRSRRTIQSGRALDCPWRRPARGVGSSPIEPPDVRAFDGPAGGAGATVEPTPRQRLYFHRVADGCLQAACAVSLFHPWATGPRSSYPSPRLSDPVAPRPVREKFLSLSEPLRLVQRFCDHGRAAPSRRCAPSPTPSAPARPTNHFPVHRQLDHPRTLLNGCQFVKLVSFTRKRST